MDIINNWKKTFVCLHPPLNNAQLTKDPGMFAYIMDRDFGYDGYAVSYKNGDYPDLITETPGLKLILINKGPLYSLFRSIPDRLLFIWHNAKNIDVLQLFQFSIPSLFSGILYKWLNPKGIIYIKLDKDFELFSKPTWDIGIDEFLLCSNICHYNIISVESECTLNFLKSIPKLKRYKDDFHYIPNGVDIERLSKINKKSKEKLILCSGNDCKQKAIEIAIQAFKLLKKDYPEWRMELLGNLSKDEYYKKLSSAKIFMAPSRWEAFGLLQMEAAYFENIIIGSDLTAMCQITNNGAYGGLCPIDDLDCFTKKLRFYITHSSILEGHSKNISEHIIKNFSWKDICAKLEILIQESQKPF